jgi:sec-independent protein translocase protein TatB
MFDIGFSEVLIIAVVALIVLGPERLPKAARLAGLWVRRARAQWYSVKAELERELAQEELRRSLSEPLAGLATDAGEQMRALGTSVRAPFDAAAASLGPDLRATDALLHDPAPALPQDPPAPSPGDPPAHAPTDPPAPLPHDPPSPAPRDPTPAAPADPAPAPAPEAPAPRDPAAPPT